MADIPAGGPVAAPGRAQAVGTLANWTGAAVSLALVVGIGVWGYRTLARDVSGVPVVRAASGGVMRVQPQDPGGRQALNQGLAVNSVAAVGSAEAPADRLVLAPAPVTLTDEDAPMGQTIALSAPLSAGKPQPKLPAVQGAPVAEAGPLSPQMASIRALAEQLATGVAPLDQAATKPSEPEKVVATLAAIAPVKPPKSAVKGRVSVSLRPILRPNSLNTAPASVPVSIATSIEIDPAKIPAGTRLAQLGAFDSPEVARKEWDRLNVRFEDYLDGKQRVVQKAKSGGRVFYRLRAMGFSDINDARRFCSALLAERTDCIPVTTR